MSLIIHHLKLKGIIFFRLVIQSVGMSFFVVLTSVFLMIILTSHGEIGFFYLFNFHIGILIYIQRNRLDINFLKGIHPFKYKLLLFLEYLILSTPFFIVYLIENSLSTIWYSPLTIIILFILIQKNWSFNRLIVIPYFLNKESYEWISFFRNGAWFYFAGVLMLIISSQYFSVEITTSLFLIYLTFIITYAYSVNEPIYYIINCNRNTKMLIKNKMKYIVIYFILFSIPTLLLFILSRGESWYSLVYVYIISIISLINAVSLKLIFWNQSFIKKITMGFNFGLIVPVLLSPLFALIYLVSVPYLLYKSYIKTKQLLGC
ncbi:MAG: hypothetical protein L3J06_02690 [Cyclobacteriaceae bacterium]|nr:hypothetical protein [Cyclobacteriaceae bacterium]